MTWPTGATFAAAAIMQILADGIQGLGEMSGCQRASALVERCELATKYLRNLTQLVAVAGVVSGWFHRSWSLSSASSATLAEAALTSLLWRKEPFFWCNSSMRTHPGAPRSSRNAWNAQPSLLVRKQDAGSSTNDRPPRKPPFAVVYVDDGFVPAFQMDWRLYPVRASGSLARMMCIPASWGRPSMPHRKPMKQSARFLAELQLPPPPPISFAGHSFGGPGRLCFQRTVPLTTTWSWNSERRDRKRP